MIPFALPGSWQIHANSVNLLLKYLGITSGSPETDYSESSDSKVSVLSEVDDEECNETYDYESNFKFFLF